MISSIYVNNDDWYLLIHTWQSVSEQTLPTADNSVPLLHPQNRHASELLVVGLPMAEREKKAKNVLMKHKGLILYQTSNSSHRKQPEIQQLLCSQTILFLLTNNCPKAGANHNNQDREQVITVVLPVCSLNSTIAFIVLESANAISQKSLVLPQPSWRSTLIASSSSLNTCQGNQTDTK